MTLHCDTMIPSSRRTRKESLLVVATLSLASLCCVVCAEGPSASGAGHEHFLQEFSDFEDEDNTAFEVITTESELPEVTTLGLHDIQQRFQTLLHGFENNDKEHSSVGERGLQPKAQKALAKQAAKANKVAVKAAKDANKAANKAIKANKGAKNADKKGKNKNKGKKVKAPTGTPTAPASGPTRAPTLAPHSSPSTTRRARTNRRRRLQKKLKYL